MASNDTGYTETDLPGDETVDLGIACLMTCVGLAAMVRALWFF